MSPTPLSCEEIAVLAKAAGLNLCVEHFDELVQAYRKLEPVLLRVRRDRPRSDEPAHQYDPRKYL